ncbi:hypothetical protein LINPERPRIM_LOCUS26206 [Linum perenne]
MQREFIRLDSRCAVSLIRREEDGFHQHSVVVDRIHELLWRAWEVEITHIYRKSSYSRLSS